MLKFKMDGVLRKDIVLKRHLRDGALLVHIKATPAEARVCYDWPLTWRELLLLERPRWPACWRTMRV